MAMKAMYNAGAQLSLAQMNKNITKAGSALAKLSSGQRIIGLQDDDSASFSISEKMREQIRSLLQDNQNVQNGSSMLKTAERGIDQIIQEISRLKQLAINAANDSNTDDDRRTIQKEFNSCLDTINDIAIGTEYNGKRLLDGTWSNKGSSTSSDGSGSVTAPDPPIVSEPTTEADFPSDGNITSDGVYKIPAGFTGTISIGAKNVKLTQTSPLTNVTIEGPAGGGANLWLENITISGGADGGSIVQFHSGGNNLTLVGSNSFSSTDSDALINVGGGLTVQGKDDDDDNAASVSLTHTSTGGACIGSNKSEDLSNSDVNIFNLTLTAQTYSAGSAGAGIGSGSGGKIGNITISNSTMTINGGYNANIGSGASSAFAGDITIYGSTITSKNVDTGIGSGYPGCSCGNISIYDSTMNVSNTYSACIGAGEQSKCGNILLNHSVFNGNSTQGGAGIGSGINGSTAGDITIENATAITHVSPNGGAAIGSGAGGHVGTITIVDAESLELLDASGAYQADDHTVPGVGHGLNGTAGDTGDVILGGGKSKFNPLWIQHGTQAGQRIHCYINSMQTKDIQGTIPNEADVAQLSALEYDSTKKDELQAIINAAKKMTLDDAKVNTRDDAKIAIRVVEGALEYALNEATTQGAYLQRLEYTDSNVTTMGENVQNAESTIRDVDMAREMTEYTKYNILTQSSQAMLAQANQNQSSILSLLQ